MARLEAKCEGMLVSLRPPKGEKSTNFSGDILLRGEYGAELVEFFGEFEAVAPIVDAIDKEVELLGTVGARTNKFDGSAQLSFRVTKSRVSGVKTPVAEQQQNQIDGQTSITEAVNKGRASARN